MHPKPLLLIALIIVIGAAGLVASIAAPSLPPARAQSAADLLARPNWTTYAGGDAILALAADPLDPRRVWAGTEGGGVVVWRRTGERVNDPDSWSFNQHLFPAPDGPAGNIVRDIAFDAAGRAWLATNGGVTLADGAVWRHDAVDAGLPTREILAIAAGSDGALWAGTAEGIASLTPGASRWTVHATVPYEPKELVGKDGPGWARVVDIAVDQRGDVWLAHGRGGVEERPALSVFRSATATWDHVKPVGPGGGTVEDGPPSEQITALAFDPSTKRLWTATWGRGVVYFDGARGAWRRPITDGLCSPFVWSLYARDGVVLAGCGDNDRGRGNARWAGNGWDKWDQFGDEWVSAFAMADGRIWRGFNSPDGWNARRTNGAWHRGIQVIEDTADNPAGFPLATVPQSNAITDLEFEPNGTLWVGSLGAGVLRRATDGTWRQHPYWPSTYDLTGGTITDLALRSGELWVATTQTHWDGKQFADGGVSRMNLTTQKWGTPIRPSPGGLPDGDVSSLAVAPDGRVWIGMGAATGGSASPDANHAGDGLAVFDPALNLWAFHRFSANAPRQLTGDTVMDLAFDGQDLWAATSYHRDTRDQQNYGGGISVLRPSGWTGWLGGDAGLEIWRGDRGRPGSSAFITGDVRAIAIAPDHTVWAGSWRVGAGESVIDRWPAVDAVIAHFDGSRWLTEAFPFAGWVSAIATDREGRVWVGTTRGHALQEVSLDGEARDDSGAAGLYVRGIDGTWTAIDPSSSGVTANAITALAMDPVTGNMWVGTENGGLSVFGRPAAPPSPTATLCAGCPTPTATRTPSATATGSRTPSVSATPTGAVEATPTPGAPRALFLPWLMQ
jgi:ligand-binding sensor domain-containing protein